MSSSPPAAAAGSTSVGNTARDTAIEPADVSAPEAATTTASASAGSVNDLVAPDPADELGAKKALVLAKLPERSTIVSRPISPAKVTSSAWQHFVMYEQVSKDGKTVDKRVMCIVEVIAGTGAKSVCGKTLTLQANRSTSNYLRHLERQHKSEHQALLIAVQEAAAAAAAAKNSKGTQRSLTELLPVAAYTAAKVLPLLSASSKEAYYRTMMLASCLDSRPCNASGSIGQQLTLGVIAPAYVGTVSRLCKGFVACIGYAMLSAISYKLCYHCACMGSCVCAVELICGAPIVLRRDDLCR
jgi:hypothetical protein